MASVPRNGCSPILNRGERHSHDPSSDLRLSNIDHRCSPVPNHDQRRSPGQNLARPPSPGQFFKPDRNLNPLRNIKTFDLRRSASRTIEGQTDDRQQVVLAISGTTATGRLRRLGCISCSTAAN